MNQNKHAQMFSRVILKPGRHSSLLRHHPWVFSGAISEVKGNPAPGSLVEVFSCDGTWLAVGSYSPFSQIRVRIWSFMKGASMDAGFLREQLGSAMAARRQLLEGSEPTACRLVNAESDGLPGLVVDRYGDFLVCQFLSMGAEFFKDEIVRHLEEATRARGIFERSDTDTRTLEGLDKTTGTLWGEDPPELIEIDENGIRFLVDVRKGHKTGFYLDQRDNRKAVGEFSHDAEALNCFSYTGAFAMAAIKGGAREVTNIDSSGEALDLALKVARLNGMDEKILAIEDDVFKVLRAMRDARRKFDLIILDPPKFAASAKQLPKACRGYKDINMLAFRLLRPGGTLFTFSCSGHMTPDLFQKVVADAALDAGSDAQITAYLGQSSDHPVSLAFPEGQYLKGLVCRTRI